MTDQAQENRQAGVPPGDMADEPPTVATGDRREEVRYEPDANQLTKARFTAKPEGPLPPELPPTAVADEGRAFSDEPPVQDVAVSTSEASVWDARPPKDEPERTGEPPPP